MPLLLNPININGATMLEWNPNFYGQLGAEVYVSKEKAAIDAALALRRIYEMNKRLGPRVGDFVQFPDEDGPRRFTYRWADDGDMLTTVAPKGHPCSGDASFYISRGGRCDFSGSLDSAIPLDQCRDTGEIRLGRVWFFSGDRTGARRGVSAYLPFRVYQYEPRPRT